MAIVEVSEAQNIPVWAVSKAQEILDKRNCILEHARNFYPERFKGKKLSSFKLPQEVWINPPESKMTP